FSREQKRPQFLAAEVRGAVGRRPLRSPGIDIWDAQIFFRRWLCGVLLPTDADRAAPLMITRQAVALGRAELPRLAFAIGEPGAEGLRIVPTHPHRRVRGALLDLCLLPLALRFF